MMTLKQRLLVRVNALIRAHVFCRRPFIRALFHVDVVAPPTVQSYCEWESLAIRALLRKYLRPEMRVLDVGTGAHALLAICVKKRAPSAVVLGTDILPERVALACDTVRHNKVDVACEVADMFDRVDGRFDLVLFNPPAIPTEELAERGFDWQEVSGVGKRRCWSGDGGGDGLDIIRSFVEGLGQRLMEHGRALLSVNAARFDLNDLRSLHENAKLRCERVHRWPGIVNTYVLAHA
jgi:methylase of polypeptide subunit release factors